MIADPLIVGETYVLIRGARVYLLEHHDEERQVVRLATDDDTTVTLAESYFREHFRLKPGCAK